jgi:hypothetical protein
MHRANFHDMSNFLALQNAISTTTSHASNIQQFRAVDHVVILRKLEKNFIMEEPNRQQTFSSSDADAARLHLETQATLILPERRRHSRFHTRRRDLSRLVKSLVLILHALLNSG